MCLKSEKIIYNIGYLDKYQIIFAFIIVFRIRRKNG